MKYFRECSSSRLIAVVGFFISFPVFLISKKLNHIPYINVTTFFVNLDYVITFIHLMCIWSHCIFFSALMLCVVLRLKRTPALTAVVVLIIGTVLGLLCMVQNIYHWYDEMSSASRGLPAYKDSNKDDDVSRDLNTLV